MDQLFPKKNPEAAKKLLETPDEKLTNAERDKKFRLAVATTPMPCPMCLAKVSLVDAADDTFEIGGDEYNGKYICPNCEIELAKIVPFFLVPGSPGWHWQRKYPVAGKQRDNGERVFLSQEIDLLVAEHDAIEAILLDPAARGRRRDPPLLGVSGREDFQLVTPTRLRHYLERRGWRIDEGGSDDVHRTWETSSGKICYTHAVATADAEVMAWDVESVALGEDCSTLRVLVGLLALEPLT